MNMFTIAFIDKFPIVRKGAEIMLAESFPESEILTSADVADFLVQYPASKPDVFILSVNSGSVINPFMLIPFIKHLFNCPVIIYDDTQVDQLCLKYFSAGASGYVSMNSPESELIECIRAVRLKKSYASANAMEVILKCLSGSHEFLKKNSPGLKGKKFELIKSLHGGMKVPAMSQKLQESITAISVQR
jgi:DNA-binding NarL/FixJ family response regulator